MILPIMALVLLHFYVTISKNFQISVFLRGGTQVLRGEGSVPPVSPKIMYARHTAMLGTYLNKVNTHKTLRSYFNCYNILHIKK